MIRKNIFIVFFFITITIYSQESIPNKTGFDGFLRFNFGHSTLSSNNLSGFMSYNLTKSKISSIEKEPEVKATFLLTLPFELAYTFVPNYTMVFVGQALEDLLRFDVAQQFGIRQRIDGAGIFKAGVLLNGIPTRVWEDPFLTNVERLETSRTSFGFRIAWDMIFNSKFRIQYTFRDVKIDNETSGNSLSLSEAELNLLDRNGKFNRLELLHRFYLDSINLLIPSISFISDNRNGTARAKEGFDIKLTYAYKGKPFSMVTNLYFGKQMFTENNPIFNIKQKDNLFGFSLTTFYDNPWDYKIFGSKPFKLSGTLLFANTNSNINFYHQNGLIFQLGLLVLWD